MRQFGGLEAVIMHRLWAWGRPALAREMVDDLRKDRQIAYTTVMTVIDNLYREDGCAGTGTAGPSRWPPRWSRWPQPTPTRCTA
jgi:predicted transcriptional regulator